MVKGGFPSQYSSGRYFWHIYFIDFFSILREVVFDNSSILLLLTFLGKIVYLKGLIFAEINFREFCGVFWQIHENLTPRNLSYFSIHENKIHAKYMAKFVSVKNNTHENLSPRELISLR